MLMASINPKGLVWLPLPLFRSDQDQKLREARREKKGGVARRQRVNRDNYAGNSHAGEALKPSPSAVRSRNPEDRDGDVACQCGVSEKGERSIESSQWDVRLSARLLAGGGRGPADDEALGLDQIVQCRECVPPT